MRKVQSPDDALSSSSSSLQVHSLNNVAGGKTYSAAEDCKRILEMEGGEDVRAGVKREKRELNRGIHHSRTCITITLARSLVLEKQP